ncbi:hypothetical protein GCM10010470_08920 [Saccharopolyspora taberi]|uniref:Uncharacterized protein n=1 Tax=Saccharopolyspora taberi TaxID=60895 RepID=A0ABN3V4F1_9PSEU
MPLSPVRQQERFHSPMWRYAHGPGAAEPRPAGDPVPVREKRCAEQQNGRDRAEFARCAAVLPAGKPDQGLRASTAALAPGDSNGTTSRPVNPIPPSQSKYSLAV